jgi:hypothetical protein
MDIIYLAHDIGSKIIYYCFQYDEIISFIRDVMSRPIYENDDGLVVTLRLSIGNYDIYINSNINSTQLRFTNHKLFFLHTTINNIDKTIYEIKTLPYDFIHKSISEQRVFLSLIDHKTLTFNTPVLISRPFRIPDMVEDDVYHPDWELLTRNPNIINIITRTPNIINIIRDNS